VICISFCIQNVHIFDGLILMMTKLFLDRDIRLTKLVTKFDSRPEISTIFIIFRLKMFIEFVFVFLLIQFLFSIIHSRCT
jgi:hypothetical protein